MNTNQSNASKDRLYLFWRRGRTVLFSLAVAVVTSLAATGWADSLYIVTNDDASGDSAIIMDSEQEEAPDFSSQIISVIRGSRGYDIMLEEDTAVTIRHEDEAPLNLQSNRESISSLLGRLQLTPGPLEMVGVNLTATGVELTVSSEIVYYEQVTERAPYNTVRVENPDLQEGEERVVQVGANGVRTSVYEVVWSNGEELSRQFVEELESTAVDKIVEYGTAAAPVEDTSSGASETSGTSGTSGASSSSKPSSAPSTAINTRSAISNVEENADGSGVLYLKDGTQLNYSGVRSMSATAYTSGYGGVGTRTASGTTVHVGTVAVDKSVIPLGTRMYIVADGGIVYGLAVAEDTGVKGSKVDLYFNSYDECIQFGRRNCTVYILE